MFPFRPANRSHPTNARVVHSPLRASATPPNGRRVPQLVHDHFLELARLGLLFSFQPGGLTLPAALSLHQPPMDVSSGTGAPINRSRSSARTMLPFISLKTCACSL